MVTRQNQTSCVLIFPVSKFNKKRKRERKRKKEREKEREEKNTNLKEHKL